MARRPFLKTIAIATSMGEHEGSPHCTSRALIMTVSGTARMAVWTVSGNWSLTQATTRAEAFLVRPSFDGSNMVLAGYWV